MGMKDVAILWLSNFLYVSDSKAEIALETFVVTLLNCLQFFLPDNEFSKENCSLCFDCKQIFFSACVLLPALHHNAFQYISSAVYFQS